MWGTILKAVGGASSAAGGYLNAKQQNKAAKDQAKLNNDQRQSVIDAKAKELAALDASGWNVAGVNKLGSSSEGTSRTRGHEDTYSKENPFVTAEYSKLDSLVRGIMENRLSRGSSLPPGYEQNAIRAINAASAGGAAAASNAAARHGLSGAQVFGLNAPIQTARAGKIADLRGNTPLLERQMANEDMSAEAQRQAQFGTGHETRGTRDYNSTTNTSEIGSHDVAPNIGDLSSLLSAPGAQQSLIAPNSALGSMFSAGGAAVNGINFQPQGASAPATYGSQAPGHGTTSANQCPPDAPGVYPFCY